MSSANRSCRVFSTFGGITESDTCSGYINNFSQPPVPLWRGRQELLFSLKEILRIEREGGLAGCELLRIEARVTGIGVEEAILWLRAQEGKKPLKDTFQHLIFNASGISASSCPL
jgi:hypothetical protein